MATSRRRCSQPHSLVISLHTLINRVLVATVHYLLAHPANLGIIKTNISNSSLNCIYVLLPVLVRTVTEM